MTSQSSENNIPTNLREHVDTMFTQSNLTIENLETIMDGRRQRNNSPP